MKRAKSLENRKEAAVREKEGLLKDIETLDSLKLNVLEHHSRRLISLDDIAIRYGDSSPLMEHFSLEICQGDRIALSGKNGCGKTSLMKLILGEDIPHTGQVWTAGGLVISYISQDTSYLSGTLSELAVKYGISEPLLFTVLRKLGLEPCAV